MVMLITNWVTCVPSQDAGQAWVPEIGQARRVPPGLHLMHKTVHQVNNNSTNRKRR